MTAVFLKSTRFTEKVQNSREESVGMTAKRGLMSDALKEEIAKELGVYNTVKAEGWGAVSSRDCGNIVKKAIEFAERNMAVR